MGKVKGKLVYRTSLIKTTLPLLFGLASSSWRFLFKGAPKLSLARRLHRRTLEALRLRKCNRTVVRWNTPTVRGMLQQVKRLVVIETEEMYKARKQEGAKHLALRSPLVVTHLPASASNSSE
ncbi:hypothetical protein RHGRI_017945 [Rhododendron griersonianum]|uniref:Large ribosomal subunit protein uL30m n=1 Tax=Rhododendron griersonianum TaxID=479676 RepID=A0AAV6JZQ2_9ERIC|nr:hypothetical protein RHGRI_017945 [Rhododendron griersonianum]KAG5545624.1 hypothetical protein RHGRI_017945 [Rhododendron griersonianum]